MTIGLTGGIGCGKSSALGAFGEIGFSVVDADGLAAEIRSEPEFLRFARERFGGNAFAADGSVDRASLARIVFSDAAAREDLENFLHPRIRARWNARSEETQLERLEKRGLPRERARERIAAQLPLEEKVRRADAVIFNDGSREFLEAQVREIAARCA